MLHPDIPRDPVDDMKPGVRRRVMIATLASVAMGPLPVFLTGALGTEIVVDLTIDDARFGTLVASFFAATAVTSVPAGRLADRLGWVRALRLAAAGSVAALLGLGTFSPNGLTLAAWLIVAGAAFSLAGPAGNLALTNEITRRRGLAFGLKQAAVPVATLYAGLALPLLAVPFGWRLPFLIGLVFPAIVLVATMSDWERVGTPQGRATRLPAVGERSPAPIGVAMAVLVAAATASALTSFLTLGLVDRGMGSPAAGMTLVAASVAGLGIRIGAGWVVDLRPISPLGLASALLTVGVAGLLLLGVGPQALLPVGALLAFGAGWGWQGLVHYGVSTLGGVPAGRATGVVMVGASVGGVLGPPSFGWLVVAQGYPTAWMVTGGAAALSAGLLALRRSGVRGAV